VGPRDATVAALLAALVLSACTPGTPARRDLVIGVVYGGISGYAGGMTDDVMMRVVDLLYGVPHLLSTILLMVVLGPGLFTIIVAMVATGWLGMARLVRGQLEAAKR
jgi:ABC-type dipeptide/oligopeptide/nickel transport system permease subunit